MFSEARLFKFCHCTHGYEVSVVKNYPKEYNICGFDQIVLLENVEKKKCKKELLKVLYSVVTLNKWFLNS